MAQDVFFSWVLRDLSGKLKDFFRELKDFSAMLNDYFGELKHFCGKPSDFSWGCMIFSESEKLLWGEVKNFRELKDLLNAQKFTGVLMYFLKK